MSYERKLAKSYMNAKTCHDLTLFFQLKSTIAASPLEKAAWISAMVGIWMFMVEYNKSFTSRFATPFLGAMHT